MSMFGTSQGSFKAPMEHKPIMAPAPTGAKPPAGVVMKPIKTGTVKPAANKMK